MELKLEVLSYQFLSHPILESQTTVISQRVTELRAQDSLLRHCRFIVKYLSQSQTWLEHERRMCKDAANFAQTAVVLDKLL